jgi:hypothetical protein
VINGTGSRGFSVVVVGIVCGPVVDGPNGFVLLGPQAVGAVQRDVTVMGGGWLLLTGGCVGFGCCLMVVVVGRCGCVDGFGCDGDCGCAGRGVWLGVGVPLPGWKPVTVTVMMDGRGCWGCWGCCGCCGWFHGFCGCCGC